MKSETNTNTFLIVLLLILLFGVLLVYDASAIYSLNIFGGKYHFLIKQAIWVGVGLSAFFATAKINLKLLKKVSLLLMIFSLVCLILVLIPGVGTKALGARRWLGISEFSFQPAELAKLSFIIYFSFWAKKLKHKKTWLLFLALFGILIGLVLLQPDLGTALVIGVVGFGMYFVSGAPLKHFLILTPLLQLQVYHLF
jgi:cell division protein FtsW